MNAPHRRDVRRHNLAGISLIELLIGITIGLLVVLAALGTLIVSRGAATAISEAAELQQQASFALRGLGLQLRQTGSLELTPVTDTADAFTFTDFTGTVVSGSDGTSGAPDRLSLGHQASRILTSRDCVGDTATAGTTVGSGYRVLRRSIDHCQRRGLPGGLPREHRHHGRTRDTPTHRRRHDG